MLDELAYAGGNLVVAVDEEVERIGFAGCRYEEPVAVEAWYG